MVLVKNPNEGFSTLETINPEENKWYKLQLLRNQEGMIHNYIKHFVTGEADLHKKANEYWIADKQPVIETTLGYIECYADPL